MNQRLITKKDTKKRRKTLQCKVYSIKLDKSHFNTNIQKHLNTLFKEAKWFYNYCISQTNINNANTTIKTVQVKVKDNFENRTFSILSAQMKQGIKARLISNVKTLKTLKKKGKKIGKIKFKSFINSIPLTQYNVTYFIKGKKIKIQKLDQWLRVNGLKQIPKDVEFANANLIHKNNDYYINITAFSKKEEKSIPEASIGIDFGCETQLTFSNGIKVKFQVPASKRLKKLDRKIMRKNRKDSKNKYKDQIKRRKEYEKITNKKKDFRCKLVNAIINNYQYVCFQDENIYAWAMCGHGKKIQNTGIGGIISDLKHKSVTPCIVNKFFPSTQLCICGKKNKLSLSQRTYSCSCGFSMDRDIKAAKCIEEEGLNQVPRVTRELTLKETITSIFFTKVSNITGVTVNKLGR